MKKFLIGIIIALTILLIGQLIYFNFKDRSEKTSKVENQVSPNKVNEIVNSNNMEDSQVKENMIVPEGLENLRNSYTGSVNLDTFQEELYNFINVNLEKIYSKTIRKSNNNILQKYDLDKEEINKMCIYSAKDFLGIATEIFNVAHIDGVNFKSASIDMETYNGDDSRIYKF